jgi:hypothetical protein
MNAIKTVCAICLGLVLLLPLAAQEESADENAGEEVKSEGSAERSEEESKGGFSMEIELGAKTFNEDDGEQVTYQSLGLYPEFSYGKWGIGLGIDLNYRFVDDDGNSSFQIREEDWVPDSDRSFLDLYLPIFRYVRYGEKGDPLYGKIGSIEDGTLGNGFLMGNYSNTLLLPEKRFVGLALDVDGRLFEFPYLGVETFVGNIARFDVLGTRVYTRPLVQHDNPLLSELQIGATAAADTQPDAIDDFIDDPDTGSDYSPDAVQMFSVDFFQPVVATPAFSGAFYGDAAMQPSEEEAHTGGLVGFGGKMVEFINYSVNTLLLGDNFVPFYFDSTYDLYRQQKYEIYSERVNVPGYAGWLASLGFGFFDDSVVFNTSVDSAFVPQSGKDSTFPHLRSTFSVGEGVLPGIYFDITYDKKYIKEFADFGEPENSLFGANIYYKAGPAVINLGYSLRYVPAQEDWETTARLSTSISL